MSKQTCLWQCINNLYNKDQAAAHHHGTEIGVQSVLTEQGVDVNKEVVAHEITHGTLLPTGTQQQLSQVQVLKARVLQLQKWASVSNQGVRYGWLAC